MDVTFLRLVRAATRRFARWQPRNAPCTPDPLAAFYQTIRPAQKYLPTAELFSQTLIISRSLITMSYYHYHH